MNSLISHGAVPRVLVGDDSETIQKVVRIALARHPVKIEVSASWADAAVKMGSGISLLLLDVNLPGVGSDPAKLKEVVASAGAVPVVVMQGSHDRSLSEAALSDCGIVHVIQKPFDSNELIALVIRLAGSPSVVEAVADIPFEIGGLPPLPADLVDASRKGKKAYDAALAGASSMDSGTAPHVAPEFLFSIAPPPLPPQLGVFNKAPPPPPPPLGVFNKAPAAAAPQKSEISEAEFARPGGDEMAKQVRQAVEAYCERHFRSLAIEVISAELRRLAEEKARHLVDI